MSNLEENVHDIVNNKCSLCYKGKTIEDYNKISMLCNSIRKYRNLIRLINEYAYQEIVSRTMDIKDFIDDDKEGNKDIIGELKEEREHWRDILRLISNTSKSDLYCNWWEVVLYD